MQNRNSFLVRGTFFLLFIILFVYSLILAKAFLVPLSFGLLFSSLMFPVCRFLCKLGLHKRLSIFISIILMGLVFAGVSILVATEINDLVTGGEYFFVRFVDPHVQVHDLLTPEGDGRITQAQ